MTENQPIRILFSVEDRMGICLEVDHSFAGEMVERLDATATLSGTDPSNLVRLSFSGPCVDAGPSRNSRRIRNFLAHSGLPASRKRTL
ncbi:hypothetical protein JKG47_12820 [Acidithiobacillus sp. MC6.1]|nr:hypothetical protein [Acidithiobacillus sp. MC6.1]